MATSIDLGTASKDLRTQAARTRGERLYPSRASRLYWVLTRLREEMEWQANHISDADKIADYGCGNMPYRSLFEPRCHSYFGCDLPGNELADVLLTSAGDLPFAENSVSCVISNQVLEHVENPKRYLAEARRVLQPGGSLVLSTHGVWRYHPDPLDLWRWTSDGLRKEIVDAGFRINRFVGILGPEATALQLLQDTVVFRYPTWLRALYFRHMQKRIRVADGRCSDESRNSDASVYVLSAEKCE